MIRELTLRQKEILEYLKEFIEGSGYPPSLRDICARFNIKGPKNARKHLDALEKKGFIKRSANISRAIEVFDEAAKSAVSIPIVGRVRAGQPHLAIEDISGHVTLDSEFFRCREGFLLKVAGDSMLGAGIDDGDYVLVRPQADAMDGDIVVAMIENEATVKRFFKRDGMVILRPENPWMETIHVKEGGKELSIVGKVISIIKKVEK